MSTTAAAVPAVAGAAATKDDHLSTLPIELIHHITGYLLPTHDAGRSTLEHEATSPLLPLAHTNTALNSAVESYCRSKLLQWSSLTKFQGQMPKSKKAKTTHRGLLLRWKRTHCVWCGRRSQRKAVLATGFACCADCDRKYWPDKITKTAAKKEYHLNEDHLFAEVGDGLPIIHYGSLPVEGTVATMFLRAEVERLAQAVHGDWKMHMAERAAKAEAKKKKIKENKENKARLALKRLTASVSSTTSAFSAGSAESSSRTQAVSRKWVGGNKNDDGVVMMMPTAIPPSGSDTGAFTTNESG